MDSGAVATLAVTFVSGGLMQYLIGLYFDRRKRAADIEKIIAETESLEVDTALKLVTGLSKRVESLERELKQERQERCELDKKLIEEKRERELLQAKVGVMVRGVYALSEQVRQSGMEPVFTVPEKFK